MNNRNRTVRLAAFALVTCSILGAAGYGFYRLGMSRGIEMTAPGAAPAMAAGDMPAGAATPTADKKILYWHDPMVPGEKFDKPGKSPFMDMQLVPMYADGGGDEGTVSISPRVQQNLGIRTATVTSGVVSPSMETVGSVAYNERDVAVVQARSTGFVERLQVRAALDTVRKGQALAELYVPEWVAAQEEYLSIRRMPGTSVGGLLDAARQRMLLVGMNDAQINQVVASGKTQARFTLTSPIAGVVTELGAREGMTVMAGAPLFRINGLSTVWINAEVPENFAAQVRPGSTVEARTPSLLGTVFKGRVATILPEVNMTTRTLKARVEVANPAGLLVPGMFATMRLRSAAGPESLFVPSEAVIRTGTRSVVMLAQAGGKFVPADVEVGSESNGQAEIRKGLALGQKVVVSGQFLVDSEASLKGTTTRMSEMPAADASAGMGKDMKPMAAMIHRGQGKVEKIDKGQITLSHGPIPSLQWGPMTMGFQAPPGGIPRNLAVGDMAVFEIRQTKDGMYQITTISPTVDPAPSAPAASAKPMNEGMSAMPEASGTKPMQMPIPKQDMKQAPMKNDPKPVMPGMAK
jgi:Cu(I)/Ag(I) efflux system membrane fusion protein